MAEDASYLKPDAPLPLRWFAERSSEYPHAVREMADFLSSTYTLAAALAPDYIIAMISVLIRDYPIEIPQAGCLMYQPPLAVGVLLGPVQTAHISYEESKSEVMPEGNDLLRWFLIHQWVRHMLPRMIFGREGETYRVDAIEKYSMAYSEAACLMLFDDSLDLMSASIIASELSSDWDDDLPAPPWEWSGSG